MIELREVACQRDIAAVARLAREIWTEHYTPIIGRAQVEYMLDRFQCEEAVAAQITRGHVYRLLLHEGEPVGYAAVAPDAEAAEAFLSKIYVRKDLRGRGLGKAALRSMETLCRRRGIRTLWLTVNKRNTRSIAWYEQMGFRNDGPTVKDIGGGFVMDDYRMVKDLRGVAEDCR